MLAYCYPKYILKINKAQWIWCLFHLSPEWKKAIFYSKNIDCCISLVGWSGTVQLKMLIELSVAMEITIYEWENLNQVSSHFFIWPFNWEWTRNSFSLTYRKCVLNHVLNINDMISSWESDIKLDILKKQKLTISSL